MIEKENCSIKVDIYKKIVLNVLKIFMQKEDNVPKKKIIQY